MFWIVVLYLRLGELSLIISVLPRQHWHLASYLDFTKTFLFFINPHIEQYLLAHKESEKSKRVALAFPVSCNGYFSQIFASISLVTWKKTQPSSPHIIFYYYYYGDGHGTHDLFIGQKILRYQTRKKAVIRCATCSILCNYFKANIKFIKNNTQCIFFCWCSYICNGQP